MSIMSGLNEWYIVALGFYAVVLLVLVPIWMWQDRGKNK